jgi:hypothetical protein
VLADSGRHLAARVQRGIVDDLLEIRQRVPQSDVAQRDEQAFLRPDVVVEARFVQSDLPSSAPAPEPSG